VAGTHRRNFLLDLASAIGDVQDRGAANTGHAFNRVAAEWLGYELPENNFVDGAGDRGIDFWFESDSGFDIFQCKSHELSETGDIVFDPFDNEGVLDLGRAKLFLETDGAPEIQNEALKTFRHAWEHAVSSRRASKDPEPLSVNLRLR
jgi:hypothetical protein